MGTAVDNGRLGGFLFGELLDAVLRRAVVGEPIGCSKPATQIDQLATWAAEGKLGPVFAPCALHRPVADWAAYP